MNFQNRLRILRLEHGMSQCDLGDILGKSGTAVGYWECGIASPDIPTLIRLANLFHVSIDFLVGRANRRSAASVGTFDATGRRVRKARSA